jgi:hypoxanthine-DNA glycosylase
MAFIKSFTAKSKKDPIILVLGSIPGVTSLNAQQYYAHPRNAFWPIMADFFSFDVNEDYDVRLAALLVSGVALWDVIGQAERQGSLDSAIRSKSQIVNPIDKFVRANESIQAILLNGGKAATSFKNEFKQSEILRSVNQHQLPSTSPAYAAMPVHKKMEQWHAVLGQYF